MRRLFFSLSLITMLAVNAHSAPINFQSAPEQTALLELYTSEGCSSCPPAEAWLSKLKNSPGLWKDFVPLAFHVDYWDYLGWRDPWDKHDFSERQRRYAARWRSESIYTPGFVLNGEEWRDWAREKEGPKISRATPGVLRVSSADTNHWQASFVPTAPGNTNYEVHAALLSNGLSSNVTAGENQGRRLNHDFAVLNLITAPLTRDGDVAQGNFKLPIQQSIGNLAVAVWITEKNHLKPLQAVGGWLVQGASAH